MSDDNPFSEAQFKTLKYRPDFPARFGCLADARAFCQQFFPWYNDQHQHSGIGYMSSSVRLCASSQLALIQGSSCFSRPAGFT